MVVSNFILSKAAAAPTTLQSINPATKELMGQVPIMGRDQVEEAVQRAWKAYENWGLLEYHKRARKILKVQELIEKQKDDLACLIANEVGKPLVEAYMSEMTGPLDTCTWLAQNTELKLQEQIIQLANPLLSSKQSFLTFEPLGVIGVIAPWNYPFAIPMMTVLMSVMVGNTVVLKPSEKSSLIGIRIGELFQAAGFEEGVVSVVTGDKTTGEHLSRTKLAKLIFTGSFEGGSEVMAQAASNVTPVSLELGGKDAAIVLPDAPIDWTASGLVWGAFTNAGQACASVERVYIVRGKRTQKLIDAIVSKAKQLKIGVPTDQTVDVGPLIDERQLSKVVNHVDNAREMGAKVLCGGTRRDDLGGFFFEPTVLTDVNHSMEIMRHETFGPVLPIMIVDNEDQAIELANDSEYGLSASVWSKNIARAEGIARDLNVGTVCLNDCLVTHACPQVPWGGIRKSGFGKTHSQFGLYDLVNVKHISMDAAGGSPRLWWYPYGPSRVRTARAGFKLLHGRFPFGKLAGLVCLLWNIWRKPKPTNR